MKIYKFKFIIFKHLIQLIQSNWLEFMILKFINYKLKIVPGYMAITTAIIITVTLSVIAVSISFSSLFMRTNGTTTSAKYKSTYGAHSCLEQALLNYSLNNGYAGNELITVKSGSDAISCSIAALTTEGSNKVIKARSTVQGTTTNLILKVNATTLARVSLEEVRTY